MDKPATILTVDADHCLATWDRTLIQIWRHATTEAAAANMCSVARTFGAGHPDGATLLFIVEKTSEIPGAGARAAFARFTRETAGQMVCCAMVPEGGGFRPAIIRSVASSVATLLRQSLPYQFAESVDGGIKLLERHLTASPGGHEGLRRAVRELRARIELSPSIRSSA